MKLTLDTDYYALSLYAEKLDDGVYGVGLGVVDIVDVEEGVRAEIMLTLPEAVALRSLLGLVINNAQQVHPPTTDAPRSESAP